MRRILLLLALAASSAGAVELRASVDGQATQDALVRALTSFQVDDIQFQLRLEPNGNYRFQTGSTVLFNPDIGSRTLVRGNTREVMVNPESRLPLEAVWRAEAARLININQPLLVEGNREVSDADRQAVKDRYSGNPDLNGDGKVDITDLGILASNYGKSGTGLRGDLNFDGVVDGRDVAIFEKGYPLGNRANPAASPAAPAPVTPPAAPGTPPPTTAPAAPGTPPATAPATPPAPQPPATPAPNPTAPTPADPNTPGDPETPPTTPPSTTPPETPPTTPGEPETPPAGPPAPTPPETPPTPAPPGG
ncbi:hypothetical protein HNR42_000180 [Deinobacterium chartae]|uniref:EF-hand domain-containing protein n=1 Tax=Deinobacterium chartae TaxID=521158 RepID=A0A841HXW6_9DEIO|nr:dockerin type I domain-containing protein [Deinobacterium chartae]MBB6096768.1 hypothetical protein [Deinobacterium chartae]